MEFDELLKFIEEYDKIIRGAYGNYPDEEKRILVRTVKLTEELGELCNEVLALNSFQRKEKLDKHKLENLEDELADVVITSLLLGKSIGIDVKKALVNKINKIKERKY